MADMRKWLNCVWLLHEDWIFVCLFFKIRSVKSTISEVALIANNSPSPAFCPEALAM